MNCNELVNKGVTVLSLPQLDAPRTIVVIGVARGVTSIVAGVLVALGLPMRERSHPAIYDGRAPAALRVVA